MRRQIPWILLAVVFLVPLYVGVFTPGPVAPNPSCDALPEAIEALEASIEEPGSETFEMQMVFEAAADVNAHHLLIGCKPCVEWEIVESAVEEMLVGSVDSPDLAAHARVMRKYLDRAADSCSTLGRDREDPNT